MNYILKQFDELLVKFSATTDTSEPEIQILWTNEEKAAFLPLFSYRVIEPVCSPEHS